MTLHDLSPDELSKFKIMYDKEEKTLLIAYLLLIFVGGLGAHELYTKDKKWFQMRWAFMGVFIVGFILFPILASFDSTVLSILATIITSIGFIGMMVVAGKTLVDYFTLPKKVKAVNQEIEDELILEIKGKAADQFMQTNEVPEAPSAPATPEDPTPEEEPVHEEPESVEVVVPELPEVEVQPDPVQPETPAVEMPETPVEPEPAFVPEPAPVAEEPMAAPVTPEPMDEPVAEMPPAPFAPAESTESAPVMSPVEPVAPIEPVVQESEPQQSPTFDLSAAEAPAQEPSDDQTPPLS